MSVAAHLNELLRRHHALDKEIASEACRFTVDDVKLTELKRKKLLLKDEIEKLKHVQAPATVH